MRSFGCLYQKPTESKMVCHRAINCNEDRVEGWKLLRQMWRNSEPSEFYAYTGLPVPPEPSPQKFQDFFNQQRYLDHVAGRPIKASFEEFPRIIADGYDARFGVGALEKCMIQVSRKLDIVRSAG